MADPTFDGVLDNVYCGMCGQPISLESIGNHNCFSGCGDMDICLVGNIVDYADSQNINAAGTSKQPDEGGVLQHNPDVDSDGYALYTDKNHIELLELIRNEPCVWNCRIPVSKRTNALINAAWDRIAVFFPGWTGTTARKRFSNLKVSYGRRKKVPPSGSAPSNQKPWALDDYMAFLNDVDADLDESRTTRSNVSPPHETTNPEAAAEDSSQEYFTCKEGSEDERSLPKKKKENFGFISKKALGRKRQAQEDPLEAAILKLASKNTQKSPKKNPLQQWGNWLANELAKIPDDLEILDIQSFITNYLADKRRRRDFN